MANAFTAWLEALEIPTEDVQICGDHRLVIRATELHEEIERERNKQEDGDRSLADSAKEEELAEVRQLIEARSFTIKLRSPSEDDMLGIEKLRATDAEEWAVRLIQHSIHEPVMTLAEVKALRKKLDRGTWNGLFMRVMDTAVSRSLTLPFSWSASEKGHTSQPDSGPHALGD